MCHYKCVYVIVSLQVCVCVITGVCTSLQVCVCNITDVFMCYYRCVCVYHYGCVYVITGVCICHYRCVCVCMCHYRCVYFETSLEQWVSPSGVCSVENNLNMATDDFVDCACSHMTGYAVIAQVYDSGIIGYTIWFYIACFICMVSTDSRLGRFSDKFPLSHSVLPILFCLIGRFISLYESLPSPDIIHSG